MKRIPIKAAKDIAKQFNQSQVIILCRDENDIQHVVTYGKTLKDCELAAKAGNNLKRYMGWPENLCHATPSRLKKKGITL